MRADLVKNARRGRDIPRPLRAVIIMGMSLSVLSGCSSNDSPGPSTQEESIAWKLPDKPYPNVRDQIHALFAGQGTRLSAIEELIWRCMRAKNQMYVKIPPLERDSNPTMTPPEYGQSVAEARQGYPDKTAEESSRPDPYRDQTDAQQQAWGEAFFGPESAPKIRVTLPNGEQIETSSQGCLAESQKQVYDSLEEMLKTENFAASLPPEALKRAAADPKLRTLNASWSSCMTEKGQSGLSDPGAARARAAGSGDGVSVAVADAECEERMGYAEQREELEDRYLTAALMHYETEVTALQETNRAALTRARKILGS
ncbi:hypothetical protein ABGB12_26055 [Actinocorallia sp. B10E7]|uniref:hypothetical protein n=1 Tax=Actinocorallia sp. B10E7 TaxID=3153558 RepID=UPI00325E8962